MVRWVEPVIVYLPGGLRPPSFIGNAGSESGVDHPILLVPESVPSKEEASNAFPGGGGFVPARELLFLFYRVAVRRALRDGGQPRILRSALSDRNTNPTAHGGCGKKGTLRSAGLTPVRGDGDAISPLGKWSLAATSICVRYPGYARHRQFPQPQLVHRYSGPAG